MRLEEIDIGVVRRALDLYLAAAYPRDPAAHRPDLPLQNARSAKDLLDSFQDESHYTENELSHRYTLRLGNHAYPHMKLVLEEFLLKGEYFFTVDTHDGMVKMKSTDADYDAWQSLQAANASIRERIETGWRREGVPTLKDMEALVPGKAPCGARGRKSKGRILVVDDESDVAETTAKLLTVNGFEVEIAADGYEALERIGKRKPDVVLLDIMMPGMDGYEVCSKIKRNPATRDVPVLLVTAGTGEMIATREADGFLAKPFRQNILLSFIDHLLHPPSADDTDA